MKRTDLLSVKTFEIDPNYEPNWELFGVLYSLGYFGQ